MQQFFNQVTECKLPKIIAFTIPQGGRNRTCTQDLPDLSWKISEIPENAIQRIKCTPSFALLYNDGSTFEIPQLNNTWIKTIIESQGVEYQYSKRLCKTQRCVIVQNPRLRHKREIAIITDDSHYTNLDLHCGALFFWAFCDKGARKESLTKLGNILLNEINLKQADTYKAVQKSEFDLLTKISLTTDTIAAAIDTKMQTINESLNFIERGLN